jgi:hypothetical protein
MILQKIGFGKFLEDDWYHIEKLHYSKKKLQIVALAKLFFYKNLNDWQLGILFVA